MTPVEKIIEEYSNLDSLVNSFQWLDDKITEVIKQARNEAIDASIKICLDSCRSVEIAEGVMMSRSGMSPDELAEQIRKLKS